VHFRPGGVFPFFGVSASELHNVELSLDLLWGARAAELRERILSAPSPAARLDVLERALLAAARGFGRHRSVAFALQRLTVAPAAHRIADLADAAGVSQRHLVEKFRAEVGMAPKLFARVRRFHEAVRALHGRAQVDWADLAAALGYYDQAHLIAEFRQFCGMSPSAYLAQKGDHLGHLPL
jgi:AraC-like DNA-binding protein